MSTGFILSLKLQYWREGTKCQSLWEHVNCFWSLYCRAGQFFHHSYRVQHRCWCDRCYHNESSQALLLWYIHSVLSSLWKVIQNTSLFRSARRFPGDTGQNSTQTTSTLSPFGRMPGTNGRVTSSLLSALLLYPPAATTNALTVYLQTLHQQPAPLLDII